MRSTQLLASLYLAQAALAAPILLVAGSSAKAVFIRPARQIAVAKTTQIVFEQDKTQQHTPSSKSSTKEKATPASLLDAEGPMTTAELMALSEVSETSSHNEKTQQEPRKATKPTTTTTTTGSSNKGKISVGTLVVPGSKATTVVSQLFDPSSPRPYLVPGYYVSSQRADIMIVGIILAFVLVVAGMETWDSVSKTISWVFGREGSVRLEDKKDMEEYEDDDEEDDQDDAAPFGSSPCRNYSRDFTLPEKVDEKAGWV